MLLEALVESLLPLFSAEAFGFCLMSPLVNLLLSSATAVRCDFSEDEQDVLLASLGGPRQGRFALLHPSVITFKKKCSLKMFQVLLHGHSMLDKMSPGKKLLPTFLINELMQQSESTSK